ncbi:spindle assembly abnormal protein 6 homolog [Rhopilema esculentum]|uniref:spindle assembly abnormal protein 6 homolog n=1 Tax=Rhopilema esculentum TaxID=499914 RepID=UPI0031DBB033
MAKNVEKLGWIQLLACKQKNAVPSACSLISAKQSVIEKDSGLEIQEKGPLRDDSDKFKALSENLTTEIAILRAQLEEKAAEVDELAEDLDASENQCQALQDHSLQLANKVTEVLDVNFGLEFDIEVKENEIKEINANYQDKLKAMAEKNTHRLMREKMKWNKETRLLTAKVNEKEQEIKELKAKEQAMHVTINVLYKAIDITCARESQSYLKKIHCLEDSLGTAEESIKEQQKKNDKMEMELIELQRKVEFMQDEKCKREKVIEDLKAKSTKLSSKKAELERSLADEMDARTKDNASFSDKIDKLEKECKEADRVNSILESEVTAHKDRYRSRENEIKNLETQMGFLDRRMEEKEILIEHLLAKKRRGFFRRLLCC